MRTSERKLLTSLLFIRNKPCKFLWLFGLLVSIATGHRSNKRHGCRFYTIISSSRSLLWCTEGKMPRHCLHNCLHCNFLAKENGIKHLYFFSLFIYQSTYYFSKLFQLRRAYTSTGLQYNIFFLFPLGVIVCSTASSSCGRYRTTAYVFLACRFWPFIAAMVHPLPR